MAKERWRDGEKEVKKEVKKKVEKSVLFEILLIACPFKYIAYMLVAQRLSVRVTSSHHE